jgi:uncharacterized integral membrane protein
MDEREALMNQLYLIGFLVLAAAVAIFAIQNSGEAVVKFIQWQFHSSLVVVILISTAVGVIMAVFLSLPGTFRLRTRLREKEQRIVELEQRLREQESKRVRETS